MVSHPKPRAADRKLAEHERKESLYIWRHLQYVKVLKRSGGVCEIQKNCKGREPCDIHHVYGRGKDIHDWREQADVMLATCRQCHPQPIKHKPAGPKLAWVEEILERINGGAAKTVEAATAAADSSEIK